MARFFADLPDWRLLFLSHSYFLYQKTVWQKSFYMFFPPAQVLLCFAMCKHPYSSVAALIVQYERR